MRCIFQNNNKGYMVCYRCGYQVKITNTEFTPEQYRATCGQSPNLTKCPHLLEPTGESAKIYGCGCGSESISGIDISIYECNMVSHPLCTIWNNEGKIEPSNVVFCVTCLDNPNNQPKQ